MSVQLVALPSTVLRAGAENMEMHASYASASTGFISQQLRVFAYGSPVMWVLYKFKLLSEKCFMQNNFTQNSLRHL